MRTSGFSCAFAARSMALTVANANASNAPHEARQENRFISIPPVLWLRLQDSPDRNDLLAGPVAQNTVSGFGHQHHFLEANAPVAPFSFTALHCNDHSGLKDLGMVERPYPADDRLFVGHADAMANLGDQERLLCRVAPCVRGPQRLGRLRGARTGFHRADHLINTIMTAL